MCHPQQTESGMKSEYRLPTACRRDELYQDDSKHIRHRVITSAFQFQHRSEVMFQIHALRAQDVEHGSRVRRGHGSRQQHGRHQGHGNADIRESGNPINKESGENSSKQHTEGGKQYALWQYRFDIRVFGIHTPLRTE